MVEYDPGISFLFLTFSLCSSLFVLTLCTPKPKIDKSRKPTASHPPTLLSSDSKKESTKAAAPAADAPCSKKQRDSPSSSGPGSNSPNIAAAAAADKRHSSSGPAAPPSSGSTTSAARAAEKTALAAAPRSDPKEVTANQPTIDNESRCKSVTAIDAEPHFLNYNTVHEWYEAKQKWQKSNRDNFEPGNKQHRAAIDRGEKMRAAVADETVDQVPTNFGKAFAEDPTGIIGSNKVDDTSNERGEKKRYTPPRIDDESLCRKAVKSKEAAKKTSKKENEKEKDRDPSNQRSARASNRKKREKSKRDVRKIPPRAPPSDEPSDKSWGKDGSKSYHTKQTPEDKEEEEKDKDYDMGEEIDNRKATKLK